MTSKVVEILETRIKKLKGDLEQAGQTLQNCRSQVSKLEDVIKQKQGAIAEMLQLAAEIKVQESRPKNSRAKSTKKS